MSTRRPLRVLAAAAAGALVLGAADASAQEEPAPEPTAPAQQEPAPAPIDEVPALTEYIEEIPTASGPRPTTPPRPKGNANRTGGETENPGGSGSKGASTEPANEQPETLPSAVAEKVRREGGSLAPKLHTIATSPRFGARRRPPKEEQTRFRSTRRAKDKPAASEPARALGTAVTAGFGAGDTRMTVLLVTLLATTAAAAGAAGYRHRPRGR